MRRSPVLALLLFLSACTIPAGPASPGEGVASGRRAIIGGVADPGDPSVVMLIGQKPGSSSASLCTAEVIAPHVVLTAAHCVSPAVVGSGLKFQIFLGTDANKQGQLIAANFIDVTSTHFDPDFNVKQLTTGHDIAVAVTSVAIPRPALPVNRDPITHSDVGSALRLVGFGVTAMDAGNVDTSGVKRQVTASLDYFDDLFLGYGDSKHNTCEGDSGGPAFLVRNGQEVIVGVTSFGDVDCLQGGADTRLDSYWDSFIAPQLLAAEGSLPSDGGTGATDSGTSATTDGGTSGTGLAVGASCKLSGECASGICTLGANSFCTATCKLDTPGSCPSGTHCGDVQGTAYCLVNESGCSATTDGLARRGAAGPGALAGGLLLLALSIGLRRRAHDTAG